jgi:transposase
MFIVGFDLGKRKSQLCVQTMDGALVIERRLSTTKEALSDFFAERLPARVLIEASTSSEWVTRHLESIGCDVVVGDPRFGPMYARQDRRIKTDRRDARALADALRMGAVRPAHRRSDEARKIRRDVLVRAALVRSRTLLVNQTRSVLESEGLGQVAAGCETECFPESVREVRLPDDVIDSLEPSLQQVDRLSRAIAHFDDALCEASNADPVTRRFDDVIGIGAVTALAFKSVIDDPKRFASSRAVASYLGLVPSESSSGDSRRQGRVTKTGDTLLRTYLVQAAWAVMRSRSERFTGLRTWAAAIAARRGKSRAAVALARKLARILFAMWRDGTEFDSKLATQG